MGGKDIVDVFGSSLNANRALFMFDDFDVDYGILRQDSIRPTTRAKAADGCHHQCVGVERHDGPPRRMVVGGASRWGRDQQAIAAIAMDAFYIVNTDLKFGRLWRVAQKGYFVDGQRRVCFAFRGDAFNLKGAQRYGLGALNPLDQVFGGIVVAQKTNRVRTPKGKDPFLILIRGVQSFENLTVSAQDDQYIGFLGWEMGVTVFKIKK